MMDLGANAKGGCPSGNGIFVVELVRPRSLLGNLGSLHAVDLESCFIKLSGGSLPRNRESYLVSRFQI